MTSPPLKQAIEILQQVGFSLRVEITCVCVLVVFWYCSSLLSPQRPLLRKKLGAGDDQAAGRRAASSASVHQRRGGDKRHASEDSGNHGDISVPVGDLTSDPARLVDSAWVVPRIVKLCRAHVMRALHVYRAAMHAGLDLMRMPPADCELLFTSMVTATIRIGHAEDALQLMQELRRRGPGVTEQLAASVVRLCTSKHLYDECLALFDFLSLDPALTRKQDRSIWSCLLLCATESKAYHRCFGFFEALNALGQPSQKDYWNMVRCGSAQGDWQLLLRLLQEMRDGSIEIGSITYNTVLAACVAADQVPTARSLLEEMWNAGGVADVITYNTLMKGYAKAGNVDQCFECFGLMKRRNIEPSPVTYGILLDGCVSEKQVERAAEVFDIMTVAGCPMNTVLYTTLIKGFSRVGKVEEAMRVYEKMQGDMSVSPDLITYSVLIKANCDNSRLHEALQLLGAMVRQGLRPDEVVFNNLLVGCSKQADAELAKRLYRDMVASNIAPSNATFSIMISLYSTCKLFDEAVEMLREEPAKHKVELEPRLFSQLAQCCVRARQGRRAVEVYRLLLECSVPSASVHNGLFVLCAKLNMFDTASDILAVAAEKRGRVDARDANLILEGAVRKQKVPCIQAIVQAMGELGLPVDAKIQPRVADALR